MLRRFAFKFFLAALIMPLGLVFGQTNQITLKGKIIDETGASLPYARVSERQSKISTLTNQRGTFYLEVPAEKAHLKISYIGYNTIDTTIYFGNKSNDTVFCTFKMIQSSKEFAVVNVSSKPYQQVYETTNLNILDYTFFGQNALLLVKGKEKYQLRLMDPSEKILIKIDLKLKPVQFVEDCLGFLHLESEDSVYRLMFDSENIFLSSRYSKLDFKRITGPCIAQSDSHFFLQSYSNFNQTITYISQRKSDNVYFTLRKIEDGGYNSSLLEYSNEVNAMYAPDKISEIWEEENRMVKNKYQNEVFISQVLSQELYAPLIQVQQGVFILDHIADSAIAYNSIGKFDYSVPISHQMRNDFNNCILQDKVSEFVYVVFLNQGIYSLARLDLSTGMLGSEVRIENHTFPKKVKIFDGYVYYLYHEKTAAGFHKLFRVKLP